MCESIEIEAALVEHESVAECAMLPLGDATASDPSVCFVVMLMEVSTLALRRFLRGRLPEADVPRHFVRLDRLPRDPEGRVDRVALRSLWQANNANEEAYAAPQGRTEEAIAEIWRGALGVERVGRHDKLLGLGGYSLLAVKVCLEIEGRLDVRMNVEEFLKQTVAQCAAECEKDMRSQT